LLKKPTIKNLKSKRKKNLNEFYNSDLELIETKSTKIGKKFFVALNTQILNKHYFLFTDKKEKYKLVEINLDSFASKEFEGKIIENSQFSQLNKKENNIYLKGAVKNVPKVAGLVKYEPFIQIINTETGDDFIYEYKVANFEPHLAKTKNIHQLESGELLLFVNINLSKSKSKMYVISLDEKGKEINELFLTQGIPKNITHIAATETASNEILVNGTFADNSITIADGVFLGKIDLEKVEFLKFYHFSKLKNFYSYLSEGRQKRVEKKVERKSDKNETIKNLKYYATTHKIKKLKDGYLMLNEFYRKTTKGVEKNVVRNGKSEIEFEFEFDGYNYTHAALIKLDENGEIVWNHTYPLSPKTKPFNTELLTEVYYHDELDAVELNFPNGSETKTLIYGYDGVPLD